MSAVVARTVAAFLLLPAVRFDIASAQVPGSVKFEVASVKLDVRAEAPSLIRGGPGTADPEQITYQRQRLIRFLSAAYGFAFDQISGPGWMEDNLYTIVAKLPPGTTKEQLKFMWQNVLVERFHLKTHIIQKDFPVYELSVAKGGPKFRVEPGFLVPRLGENWAFRPAPRDIRLTFRDCSMADSFATRIGWPSAPPALGGLTIGRVVNKTALEGSYSFTLEFAGSWGPGGAFPSPLPDGQPDAASNLFDALRQQLGLRLAEGKARLDVLVVDHVDKVPTEN